MSIDLDTDEIAPATYWELDPNNPDPENPIATWTGYWDSVAEVWVVVSGTPVDPENNFVQEVYQLGGSVPEPAQGGTAILLDIAGEYYREHTFSETDAFTALRPLEDVSYLIVAGGGSGGLAGPYGGGGGGGAGGVVENSIALLGSGPNAIVVGTGGAPVSGSHTPGNEGQNSSAFGDTAIGGGRGGSGNGGGPTSGGSGGGQGTLAGAMVDAGNVAGTPGQGNDGGLAISPNGGGGGGAGAPGGTPPDAATAANGGAGILPLVGTQHVGGGGAGSGPIATGYGVTAINPPRGNGGQGGGGGEGSIDGVDGTGGGGAAGIFNVERSGAGGNGVVIVRYKITQAEYNGL